jgi:eukaryotic-like serine/threonine-protein kinase
MTARVGNFELIDRFATGGVAEIFRARDVRTGEIVVIKRIKPDADFDPEAQAGFLRELQLALMCSHKNLIRGIDKGVHNGFDYGVLEYVDGQDLQRILERARSAKIAVPLPFATYIVGEILDGIDFVGHIKDHAGRDLGLVHRDLAPKNVFVRYDGEVRVGDFGSSLATLTERADVVVGTLGYMSPEQARMDPIDHRSDVYAAGLILYELVAGAKAYDIVGKKDQAALKLQQKAQMRPVPRSVPDDIKHVIELACAPKPEDRYPTAGDMRRGLLRTAHPPDEHTALGIATLVRRLFFEEFKQTRLPGSPLPF